MNLLILLATSSVDIRMAHTNVPQFRSQEKGKPIRVTAMATLVGPKRDWHDARFVLRDDLAVYPYGWLRKNWLITSTGICGSPNRSFSRRKASPRNIYIQVVHIYRNKNGSVKSEPRWVRLVDLLHTGTPLGSVDSHIERALRGLHALREIKRMAHPR